VQAALNADETRHAACTLTLTCRHRHLPGLLLLMMLLLLIPPAAVLIMHIQVCKCYLTVHCDKQHIRCMYLHAWFACSVAIQGKPPGMPQVYLRFAAGMVSVLPALLWLRCQRISSNNISSDWQVRLQFVLRTTAGLPWWSSFMPWYGGRSTASKGEGTWSLLKGGAHRWRSAPPCNLSALLFHDHPSWF